MIIRFKDFPTVNLASLCPAICNGWFVAGFRPRLVAIFPTQNVPNPDNTVFSPFTKFSLMINKVASTASLAARLVKLLFLATFSIN